MNTRRGAFVLTVAVLGAIAGGASAPADAARGPERLQQLAKAQTKLYSAFDTDAGVSPPSCGRGQSRKGVHGTFLLPVFAQPPSVPESRTIRCTTTARRVFVDAGGFVATEDDDGPSYPMPFPDGDLVPFDRGHLDPICDDIVDNLLPALSISPAPVTVDGEAKAAVGVATGWFIARFSPTFEVEYDNSIALGHPGLLASTFCGYKTLVHLRPGRHVITVDYSANAGAAETVYTYLITVKRGHRQHHH